MTKGVPGSIAARRNIARKENKPKTYLESMQWGNPTPHINARYQVDPETFEGGYYMEQWKRLRGKP